MAQWGLKEELFSNPDIWACHNCNDCSKYCPRGARPGDVLGAMRQKFIKEFSIPRVMGNIVSEPKMTLLALAIPVILFLVVLGVTGHLGIPEGEIVYSKFFPILYIEVIFIGAVALAGVTYVMSLSRFWGSLKKGRGQPYAKSVGPAIVETVTEFLKHSKFAQCEANADRKNGHLLVFYGFVGLFITTVWITVYYYVPKIHSPIPLGDPMKWLANLSALALLVGVVIIAASRLKDKGINSQNSSFDWTFVVMVVLITVTGILTELVRLAGLAAIAYPMYFIHLVFVFYIIVFFPYSKLAHMGYRTLAIAYSKMTSRDVS